MRLDIAPKNADCIKRAFDLVKNPDNFVINEGVKIFIRILPGILIISNALLMQSSFLGAIFSLILKFGSRNLED